MPRTKKFNEESAVITLRVPKSIKKELKEEIDDYILVRSKGGLTFLGLNELLDDKDNIILILKEEIVKLKVGTVDKKFKNIYDEIQD